ncbi:hypothetical protein DQ244_00055 [Blastococcus sp. TBT05-19]|nr:hypothetical protein DQ244_00055 [Blastococcus sp. TBT05-19]
MPAAPVLEGDRPTADGGVSPAVAGLVALATDLHLGPEQLSGAVQAMFHAAADAAHQAGDHLGLPADQARTALHDIADGATADVNGRGTAAQLEALLREHGAGTADLLHRLAAGSGG